MVGFVAGIRVFSIVMENCSPALINTFVLMKMANQLYNAGKVRISYSAKVLWSISICINWTSCLNNRWKNFWIMSKNPGRQCRQCLRRGYYKLMRNKVNSLLYITHVSYLHFAVIFGVIVLLSWTERTVIDKCVHLILYI